MSAQLTTDAGPCFGTYDWEWPDWGSSYYPEDLPEDWRAAYYANEAACVCLPPARWLAAPAGRIADWCDGLPRGFRFYLELDAAETGLDRLVAQFERLGPWAGALLCASPGQRQWLRGALAEHPLDLLVPADPAVSGPFPPGVSGLWRTDGVGVHLVVRLEIDAARRRSWGERLTGLTGLLAGATTAAVFVRGPGVTPAVARDFRATAELMGLA